MICTSSRRSVRDYWSGTLDPFNRRRLPASALQREWVKAVETFCGPDTAWAIRALGELAGQRLLEVGSGLGCGAAVLAERGADVVATDISHARCVAAQDLLRGHGVSRVRLFAASAEALPFPDGSFGLLFCRDVLMYVDPAAVAAECARVLREGGRAVFVESLAGGALSRLFRRAVGERDYRGFTRHVSLEELCAFGSGLHLVDCQAFNLLSTAAFFALLVLRSPACYRALLRLLQPLDVRLLRRFPGLRRCAWRGVAVYSKGPANAPSSAGADG